MKQLIVIAIICGFANLVFSQNFGIDQPSPVTKLHINYTSSGGLTGTGAYGGLHLDQDAGNDGFTGITTSATSSGTQGGILFQGSGSYGTKIHFMTTSSYASGMFNRMTLDHTGRLGIGTSTPAEKLDVSGGNIQTTGYVLVPNRPAFSVYLTSHWTTQNAIIVYAGVNSNNGSHYSTSTGRFTAPVSGLYQFTFGGIKSTGSTTQVARMDLRRNGVIHSPQSRASEGAAYGQTSVTTILFLNAGDVVDTWNTDVAGWYTQYTFFCGFLL